MRVLIVADDAERLRSLCRVVSRAGHTCEGTLDARGLALAVRVSRPDALVLELGSEATVLRRHVARARFAAESALPVVLLVNDPAWIRLPVYAELEPCAVLAASEAAESLPAQLARFGFEAGGQALAGLDVRSDRREVTGVAGRARLTASEASVLGALMAAPGDVVRPDVLSAALWGSVQADRHARAALRTHVYTLRGKLRQAGIEDAIETLPGLGYRLGVVAEA